MTLPDLDRTLASMVTERPEWAPVFDALGLDYCCGGDRRFGEAIDAADLDVEAVRARLEATPRPPAEAIEWADFGMVEMVDHLEATHHVYLRGVLGRLDDLASKVVGVHGERHPELVDVLATFRELRADLEPHLMKEERVLFPMIRELAAASELPSFHCGTLRNPIAMMGIEHDRAGELLAHLRELTSGFVVPDDGCASYEALYRGLAALEADTHLHVHKENNVLFPAVVEAERALAT